MIYVPFPERARTGNSAATSRRKSAALIEQIDHLRAEAIREIVGLYKDGILKKPDSYAYAYPDLLTFHDSPSTKQIDRCIRGQDYLGLISTRN